MHPQFAIMSIGKSAANIETTSMLKSTIEFIL